MGNELENKKEKALDLFLDLGGCLQFVTKSFLWLIILGFFGLVFAVSTAAGGIGAGVFITLQFFFLVASIFIAVRIARIVAKKIPRILNGLGNTLVGIIVFIVVAIVVHFLSMLILALIFKFLENAGILVMSK